MSLPTLEEYRTGGTTWRREHKGVHYTLSHHGERPHVQNMHRPPVLTPRLLVNFEGGNDERHTGDSS